MYMQSKGTFSQSINKVHDAKLIYFENGETSFVFKA